MDPWIIWFGIGLALIIGELFLPGVILVFLGLAAWIVAALCGIGLLSSLAAQLVAFALASLAMTGFLRRVVMLRLQRTEGLALPGSSSSDHADEFTGKEVLLLSDFSKPGAVGKVEFKGAEWKARAEEALEINDPAEIAAVDGITLIIRRRWLN